MRRVIIESPYGSEDEEIVKRNIAYAREALRDCLLRGEAPLASHLLYTQVLDDRNPEERKLGIEAGHAWIRDAGRVVFYLDYGASPGMQQAWEKAYMYRIPTEKRFLYSNLEEVQPEEGLRPLLQAIGNMGLNPDLEFKLKPYTEEKHMPKLKSPFPEH